MSKFYDFVAEFMKFTIVLAFVYGVDFAGEAINAVRNYNIYYNQPKYTSREEIKRDLEIEKKKLRLENLDIRLNLFEGERIAYIDHTSAFDFYTINLNFSKGSQVALRHELCHAKNNFFNSSTFDLPILRQYKEWKATSCSLEE